MAVGKKDYKDSEVRLRHKQKVPPQTLVKVEPSSDDTRTRAELLDAIEDLFQTVYTSTGASREVDLEDLRAILTMLVLSATNADDDGVGATQTQVDAINLNSTNIARNASDLATFISNISISNNKVGIGTTSPGTNLQLGNGTSSQKLLLLGPNSNTNSSEIILGDSTDVSGPNHAGVGIRYNSAANILTFRSFYSGGSQDVNMMTLVRDSGNMGIGTQNPSQKLDVVGSIAADTFVSIQGVDTGNPSAGTDELRISGYGILGNRASGVYVTNENSSGKLFFGVGGKHALATRMTIDSSGNVGIGTTSPDSPLEVNGNTRFGNSATGIAFGISSTDVYQISGADVGFAGWNSLHFKADGNDGLFIEKDTNNVGIGTTSPGQKLVVDEGYINVTGAGTSHGYMLARDGLDTYRIRHLDGGLTIQNSTDSRKEMTFDGDGNVGIGTTSPGKLLDVNGTFRASGEAFFLGAIDVTAGTNSRFRDGVALNFNTNRTARIFTDANDLIIQQGEDDKDIIFKSDDGSGGITAYLTLDGSRADGTYVYTTMPDYGVMAFGASVDMQLYHNGTDSTIRNNTGNLNIVNFADDGDIIFKSDDGSGGVAEYFRVDGGGELTFFTKPIQMTDNAKIFFGVAGDLELYHDGTDSYVKNDTGDLYIQNTADDKDIIFQCDDGLGGTTTYLTIDGSEGHITVQKEMHFQDTVVARFGTDNDAQMVHSGNSLSIVNQTGDFNVVQNANDGDITFQCDDGSGGTTTYLRVDGGDESIKFYKDISNQANANLVMGGGQIKFSDAGRFYAGDSNDLQIYHDGSNSYIADTGTGVLNISSNQLNLNASNGENGIQINENAEVKIRHNNIVKLATTSTGVEVTGDIALTGSVQKQIQVFPMNFTDDLGTDKHFMPFVTNTEQTVNYQEEAAMVMPADGRVVSVTVHYAQMHGAASDITVGIETSPCGQSYTNAWTIEETETISASADDDHHVFHFAFDNAKHFESTDKMALSIQQSVDLQNASRFFWVTAVIEYDWSTFLGGTSAEYGTTP